MCKRWLLCVLFGTLAWGQAQPGMTPARPDQAQAPNVSAKPPAPAVELPENAVVLTIAGLCPAAPRTAATASKTGASKPAAAPAKKPADCKTEITRAQFEKLTKALQQGPNPLNPQQKRQLASVLPRIMAMSVAAKAKGLDKTPRFTEEIKFYTMQVLTQELQRSLQDEADKISPEKVAAYYKDNPEAYEQFSLDRLFIPRYKQPEVEDKEETKEPEKLTEEQQKAKEAADQAKKDKGEQELNKLADTLRERAAAGEDFVKLQKEAFEAAGTKVENPTVNLAKVRRTGLSAAQASVFDLKVGEVSAVISDNGGHYIYKVVSKEVVPLDAQLETEIHNKLKGERLKELMDKYTGSFQAVPNEAYFGPATAGGPPVPHMRPQMPPRSVMPQTAPQQEAPPAATAPAQPPAQQPN
jgi:hypothetical protein